MRPPHQGAHLLLFRGWKQLGCLQLLVGLPCSSVAPVPVDVELASYNACPCTQPLGGQAAAPAATTPACRCATCQLQSCQCSSLASLQMRQCLPPDKAWLTSWHCSFLAARGGQLVYIGSMATGTVSLELLALVPALQHSRHWVSACSMPTGSMQSCRPSWSLQYSERSRHWLSGLRTKDWNKRFFILYHDRLQYFKTEADSQGHPRGHVAMHPVSLLVASLFTWPACAW